MKIQRLILPAAALGAAAFTLVPVEQTEAFTTFGFSLPQSQRDFRVWNNFTDATANNNQTPHPMFPGYQGATMAIWKGSIEWGSELHGDGSGDPHQNFGLGSGGANFDCSFQGLATSTGAVNDNIHSELAGSDGGVLAFTEQPDAFGWRIRYYSGWTWDDGPGVSVVGIDLQGVACHEYGHAIGIGHTDVNGSTMYPSISGSGVSARSIGADDIAAVKFIYGVASGTKPSIDSLCIEGTQLTVTGTNFSPTGNEVWFTKTGTGGNGTPIKVTNLASLNGGTQIVCTIPGTAGPGDVLVRNFGGGHANLSNAFPSNLQNTPGGCGPACPTPVNYCIASVNSTGVGMVMSFSGTSCVSDDNFALWAFGGPPNRPGIFYYGGGTAQVPFGNGFRCVSGTTFRLPVVVIDNFGDATYPVDFDAPPFNAGAGAWLPGEVWNCQFWFRDPPAGGAGFNLTDGLTVTVGS